MPLIDDDGNLFGVVNVVDALVVLVLLAVLVAGAALVVNGGGSASVSADPDEPETRYATVELGDQPDYVVEQLSEGDTALARGWGSDGTAANVTVTDVSVTARNGDQTNASTDVTIRVALEGVAPEDDGERTAFRVDGDSLTLGSELKLDLGTYATSGTVTALDSDEDALAADETTTDTEVELRNVTPAVADGLEEGMTETVRGETVATIQSVESEPATVILESDGGDIYEREHPQNVDVTLTVELATTETETGTSFRGRQLGIGTSVVLDFDTVTVDGEVTALE
ncbi:hypothetical protein HALLA_13330 [Halostagnicola larsenii XH-48]|uniref:DUF4330 domain-containing protein n=1 Tax=Halostagnicola larsenii XH-48 TaxID=797299 RepID=W0JUS6_9EURY|nr:DUF4330 family protein [Halostagnicola larsenii]AHG01020.1 hypothetical protein HALLA_13330 [Halostagnicola larsenii XH-48]